MNLEIIEDGWEKTLNFIRRRKMAYVNLFNPESVSGQEVLKDLAKFCRANQSCFHADPRIHAALEGRREVWLRIKQQVNLTDEQLFAILK